jgi:phage shock protein PspC (stress-responsive transcriptional regulator)
MRHRLYRSRSERWIAGVCGGLSEYFHVDVSALRIAFTLLSLWHGVGLLFYLLLVLIVPDEPVREVATAAGPFPPEPDEGEHQRRARTLGTVLVFGGAYLLIQQTQVFEVLLQQSWIGVVLIVGGLLVLLLRRLRKT